MALISSTGRRGLLLGAAASIVGNTCHAQDAVRRSPIIMPNGIGQSLEQKSTLYAEMSSLGPRGPNLSPPTKVVLPGGKGQLVVWLPAGEPRGRVLVFSHGELGSPELYAPLLEHWASHGFVVLAPVHQDSVIQNSVLEIAAAKAMGAFSVLTENDTWKVRIDALRTCLDALPWLQSQFGVRMDDERPIVAGYSFGAFCASMVMGTKAFLPTGGFLEMDDSRFYAALMLSPQGRGVFGLRDGSWDSMRRPSMWLTGEGDNDITNQSAAVKAEPWQLSPAGGRHLAWLSRMRSNWISGAQIRSGELSELVFSDVRAATTAFLRAYGDDDHRILEGMSSTSMTIPAGGRLAMEYR